MSALISLGTRADFRASLGARILHHRYGGDYDAMRADWAQDQGDACSHCGGEITTDAALCDSPREVTAFCQRCGRTAE